MHPQSRAALEAAYKQAAKLHSADAMEELYKEIRREFLAALAEWHTETNAVVAELAIAE